MPTDPDEALAEAEDSAREWCPVVWVRTEKDLAWETKKLLSELKQFAESISREYSLRFASLFLGGNHAGSRLSKMHVKVWQRMEKMGFTAPSFEIYDFPNATQWLDSKGFDIRLSSSELLLVLQLPPPMAHFWWKSNKVSSHLEGYDFWSEKKDPRVLDEKYAQKSRIGMIKERGDKLDTEWGELYSQLMPVIWSRLESLPSGVALERVNDFGDHVAGKYYYVWRVRRIELEQ